MSGFDSSDIGHINEAAIIEASETFDRLDRDILDVPGHPLAQEYGILATEARTIIQRISMMLLTPGGLAVIEQGAERLGALYERAVEIRSQIAQDLMRSSFGLPAGADIAALLEPEVDRVTDQLGGMGENLRPNFQRVIETLSMDPTTDPQAVFTQMNRSRRFLEQVRETAGVTPELVALADRLSLGLNQMTAINPVITQAAAHDQWYQENFSGRRIDTKPLRVFGGIFGAFITTIGLAQTIFLPGHQLSPATVGWGLATMLFANPRLLQGNSSRTLSTIASMGSPEVREVVAAGFNGDLAARAVEELQSIRSSNNAGLRALLQSEEPLTVAQISEVAGPNSPVTEILSRMQPEMRQRALAVFGRSMSMDEVELAQSLLRPNETVI